MYAIVRAAVKRSLGQYSVAPALDFDQEKSFDIPHAMRYQPVQKPSVTVNTGYNPFEKKDNRSIAQAGWQRVYEDIRSTGDLIQPEKQESLELETEPSYREMQAFQSGQFLFAKAPEGVYLFDIIGMHERIIYHRLLSNLEKARPSVQQLLFPVTISLNPSDYQLTKEIEEDIRNLGFDLREFGLNTYVLHGIPTGIKEGDEKATFENILEQFKLNTGMISAGISERIAFSMAKSMAFRKNQVLSPEEVTALITDFFDLPPGEKGIDGKPCMRLLKNTDLPSLFKA